MPLMQKVHYPEHETYLGVRRAPSLPHILARNVDSDAGLDVSQGIRHQADMRQAIHHQHDGELQSAK